MLTQSKLSVIVIPRCLASLWSGKGIPVLEGSTYNKSNVKCKQSPGTNAIITKVLTSKPKWETTKAATRHKKENMRLTE